MNVSACEPVTEIPVFGEVLAYSHLTEPSDKHEDFIHGDGIVLKCSTSVEIADEVHYFICSINGTWEPEMSYLPSKCVLVRMFVYLLVILVILGMTIRDYKQDIGYIVYIGYRL